MTKLKKDRHTQAKKAARQNTKHYKANMAIKNKIRKNIKKINSLILAGKVPECRKLFSDITALLQRSVNKNIYSRNRVARKISSLARSMNKATGGKKA